MLVWQGPCERLFLIILKLVLLCADPEAAAQQNTCRKAVEKLWRLPAAVVEC